MKVWIVVDYHGCHEGYELPALIFSNLEAAEKYREQKGWSYEVQEYEVRDKCPEPKIELTEAERNFGLIMPLRDPLSEREIPALIIRYPKFYLSDLMDKIVVDAPNNTFSWTITPIKKRTWWQKIVDYATN